MIYLNPKYYTLDFVKQLQAKVQADMLAGIQLTTWTSEGSTFQGQLATKTEDLIAAIDRYFDEYEGNLITETEPDFYTFNTYR